MSTNGEDNDEESNKCFRPVSREKSEEAMFSIVLDKDSHLYETGNSLNGDIFLHFKDTQETVSFEELNVCLKLNVSQPENDGNKKNVITHVVENICLVKLDDGKDRTVFDEILASLNSSVEVKIPFNIYLSETLSSSFNSSHISICYEIKAELLNLQLCGEFCDMTTVTPLEIVESNDSDFKRLENLVGEQSLEKSSPKTRGSFEQCNGITHTPQMPNSKVAGDVCSSENGNVYFVEDSSLQQQQQQQQQNGVRDYDERKPNVNYSSKTVNIDGCSVTFYANLKRNCFKAGEEIDVNIYIDCQSLQNQPIQVKDQSQQKLERKKKENKELNSEFILVNSEIIDVQFEVLQRLQIKGERPKDHTIVSFKDMFQPSPDGFVLDKKVIYLRDSCFNTQPSVTKSRHLTVSYFVLLVAFVRDTALKLSIPITVKRENSLRSMYPPVLSSANKPLLPITVTASELRTDGLQSYIPMKQCYENRRLTVKKGDLNRPKAVLTMIMESYKAYTNDDKIKGFVYFAFNSSGTDLQFEKLLILLVGVLRYKNLETLHKKGEMFLYERKILCGSKNNNQSCVILQKPSGIVVVEFEFDLSKIRKTLPPSFNSPELSIDYELKADVFNLIVDGQKTSLYTKLPIILKENKLCSKLDSTSDSYRTLSTKNCYIAANIDKLVYQHKDNIVVNINLENKSRKQITVCVQLNQVVEDSKAKNKYIENFISKPLLFIVLPKSKLVSREKISLQDYIFQNQPTLIRHGEYSVTYNLTISSSSYPDHKISIPVMILRRSGHLVPELTREGYPILPLTLEFYSAKTTKLPQFLEPYNACSLVRVLRSNTCYDRWKGWKVKTDS